MKTSKGLLVICLCVVISTFLSVLVSYRFIDNKLETFIQTNTQENNENTTDDNDNSNNSSENEQNIAPTSITPEEAKEIAIAIFKEYLTDRSIIQYISDIYVDSVQLAGNGAVIEVNIHYTIQESCRAKVNGNDIQTVKIEGSSGDLLDIGDKWDGFTGTNC
jgi:hypothetical protein